MTRLESSRERRVAASRLERAGLDPSLAVAVIDEIHREESRFASAEQVGRIEVGLANLQGELRQTEARLSGRIDAIDARLDGTDRRIDGVRTDLLGRMNDVREELLGRMDGHREELLGRMDGHREELLGRMEAQFDALRRENRLLLLFFSTIIGLLMALFRFGLL